MSVVMHVILDVISSQTDARGTATGSAAILPSATFSTHNQPIRPRHKMVSGVCVTVCVCGGVVGGPMCE